MAKAILDRETYRDAVNLLYLVQSDVARGSVAAERLSAAIANLVKVEFTSGSEPEDANLKWRAIFGDWAMAAEEIRRTGATAVEATLDIDGSQMHVRIENGVAPAEDVPEPEGVEMTVSDVDGYINEHDRVDLVSVTRDCRGGVEFRKGDKVRITKIEGD